MKITTWNINSLKVRLGQVLNWLQVEQPDVLALQELKLAHEDFPIDAFRSIGYEACWSGQRTYNGVALISKVQPSAVSDHFENFNEQKRFIAASYGDTRVINLYVPNGESTSSEKYTYKLNWLHQLTQFLAEEIKKYPKLAIVGDFNIAPHNEDVHDPKAWEDKVLFSQPERQAFQNLLQLGLYDSFRLFSQEAKIFSWWDYRMLSMQKNKGLRIDHILVSQALADICLSCTIDKGPRKLERPSDHAPVTAEFKNS